MKTKEPHLRELVALSLIPNIGAQRIKTLLKAVDHPQEIFRLGRKELSSIYGIGDGTADMILRFNEWERVDNVISATDKAGFDILSMADETYPSLLREIYDPPVLLWIRGRTEVLRSDSIAVVGTRKCSQYGREMAEYFTGELVREGLTVVSGLAYGIDAAAHAAAVEAGGTTIAVLGSGIDVIYPSKHTRLASEIVEGNGAVISEFPPGTPPDAGNFPVRNRIVSGMSLGTLVIESGREGGSMITATSALDQNREVFVVPHPVKNRSGSGCNYLIKTGQGKLVQEIDDLLNELAVYRSPGTEGHSSPAERRWRTMDLDELSTSICKLLEESPRHIDEIGKQLDLPAHVLLPKLLQLEMNECVRQNAGKIFRLR